MKAQITSRPLRVATLVVLGALLVPDLGVGQSAPPQASQSKIDAAKSQGAALGRELQGSPAISADGTPTRDADKSIRRTPANSSQANDAAALARGLTGLSDYEGTANPARSGGRAGASAAVSSFTDFACGLSPGTVRAVAGRTFRFNGCRLQDSRILQIGLQVCSKLANGGLCAASDYSPAAFYDANAYSTVGDTEVGIGCNDATRSCRVTVSSTFSIQADGATLTQQAADGQGGAELRAAVSDIVASPTYQEQTTAQTQTRDCYVQNQQSALSNGNVTTCNGQTTSTVTGGPSNNACTQTRACVRNTSIVNSYETTCTRSFALTTNRCRFDVPTRECVVTRDLQSGVETSSCPAEEMNGAAVVTTTEQQCTRYAPPPLVVPAGDPPPKPICQEVQFTQSIVFPDRAVQVGECIASPAPIDGPAGPGVCAMDPQDQELSCAAGRWYGRTLPDGECQAVETDETGAQVIGTHDYRTKPGCGFCIHRDVGRPCRARPTESEPADSCSGMSLSGCSLQSSQVQSQEFGLALSQLETYRCSQTTTQCAQWRVSNTCTNIDSSYGVGAMPINEVGDEGAFAQVVAAGALVEGVAQSDGSDPMNPQIFKGEDLRCEKPLGFLDDVAANDCCKLNLQRTGGNRPSNSCSQDEVKLAAARRARHEVFVGSYCSKKRRYGFISRCVRETQTYCVFPGLLARVVQTQGRQQLAQTASTNGSALATQRLTFPYYAGEGGWGAPVTVQGQQVAVFEQPSYCSNTAQAAAYLAAHPDARECPAALGIWFAACGKAGGCGELPTAPEGGSPAWQLTLIDPLKTTQTALSRNALVRGACNTQSQQCEYDLLAWPAGIGGRAVLSRDLIFDLTSRESGASEARSVLLGSTLVRATVSQTMPIGTLPASVTAGVSFDSGSTWKAFALPAQIQGPFVVPETDIQVSGGCTLATGLCEYRLTGTIEIATKPWGSAQTPDCSGFTLEQFSALDLATMDLSEWTATIQAQLPSSTDLSERAQTQAAQGNQWTSSSPTQARVARIQPSQDLGPFVATLAVSPYWPETSDDPARNTDPIHAVEVDWGDCSAPSRAMSVPGGGFRAEHTYGSPETAGICDRLGLAGPGAGRTLNHQVRLTIDAPSGRHVAELDVRNVFQTFDESTGSSGGVTQTRTAVPPGH